MNVISNTNTPITNCESRRDLRIVIGITIVATCFFRRLLPFSGGLGAVEVLFGIWD